MADQLLETMPLRDRLREAERLVREFTQHLELGFMPKVHACRQLARPAGPRATDDVPDQSIRSSAEAVLLAHEYSVELSRKLERFLDSIDRESQKLVSGNANPMSSGTVP